MYFYKNAENIEGAIELFGTEQKQKNSSDFDFDTRRANDRGNTSQKLLPFLKGWTRFI